MPEDVHEDQPSDFSKSNDLKQYRPDLRKEHFICVKCHKEPRGWASTAYHIGGVGGQGFGGQVLSGRGVIHGALLCHGEEMEIMIEFSEAARYIESGEKIPVFDSVNKFPASRLIGGGGKLLG